MKKIIILTAMTKKFIIGYYEKLPWNIPEEIEHFKQITTEKIIIVGRKTYLSMNVESLRNRQFIIVSYSGLLLEDVLKLTKLKDDITVIGGLEIYKQTLQFATHAIISIMNTNYMGDVFFPNFNICEWHIDCIENRNHFYVLQISKIGVSGM